MAATHTPLRTRRDKIRNWTFRRVHTKNLVYNTCWEDPRCDRALLHFGPDSEVVMITSAGCNALEYLLDDPKAIHCVDVNFRQNALLELKRAALVNLTHEQLFQMFGMGQDPDAIIRYETRLRPFLPASAQEYWDRNIRMFTGKGLRKSFYYYGSSGTFAWLARQYFTSKRGLRKQMKALFAAPDMQAQQEIYKAVERRILDGLVEWALNQHLTMSLVGVPRAQQKLFFDRYEKGIPGYVRKCLRNVFLSLPANENYFYHLYLHGYYSKDCCPEYLKADNQELLIDRIDRVKTHTNTLAEFLQKNPGSYSHFILLDHQDWLAQHMPEALEEEWHLILKNSHSGTRILLRSAAPEVDFFPDFVLDRVEFEEEETLKQHALDRVGTYASVYLATVK
ncbi:MAG: BtaA family protein [Bacteroidetes bacterium]|nr:BtaA family protein [Bacteroidota bacterium]